MQNNFYVKFGNTVYKRQDSQITWTPWPASVSQTVKQSCVLHLLQVSRGWVRTVGGIPVGNKTSHKEKY